MNEEERSVIEVLDGTNEVLCKLLVPIFNGMGNFDLRIEKRGQLQVVTSPSWDNKQEMFHGALYVLTKLSPCMCCEDQKAQEALENLQKFIYGNLGCIKPPLDHFVEV